MYSALLVLATTTLPIFDNPCFVSAQHFDSRPSHKRDDHASAAYGGGHSYQADTVRFKICS